MGVRLVEGDEHFGHIGFGTVTLSAADTFSAALMPEIAEPDIIVKTKSTRKLLEVDIDDLLVWDNREWHARAGGGIDFVGAEDKTQTSRWGITKDNTVDANAAPTSDAISQGTRPGGNGAAVTGAAAGGGAGQPIMNVDVQPTRYVVDGEFFAIGNEENAVGEINMGFSQTDSKHNQTYEDTGGNKSHLLMTAAHYHAWHDTAGTGVAGNVGIGASVRKVSIDIDELLFDRGVLLSLLDALSRATS